MFTALLSFLSPFKSLIFKGIGIIILVIALYTAWHKFTGHYVHIGEANIQVKWDKERADTKVLADKQQVEIAAAIKKATDITKVALGEKDAALKKLGLEHVNRLELTKRIEALNEAHNTKLADTKHNYNERLRLEGVSSASALREESERLAGLPESASERDRAIADYDTLREACQLTTIDFNTCRLSYDADTAACGREK